MRQLQKAPKKVTWSREMKYRIELHQFSIVQESNLHLFYVLLKVVTHNAVVIMIRLRMAPDLAASYFIKPIPLVPEVRVSAVC